MGKKILIAFDDSEYSFRAIQNVAEHFTKDHEIKILSIVPNTAAICTMYSPELIPQFSEQQGIFCAMEEKNKGLLEEAQTKAKKILLEKGFREKDIKLEIKTADRGVARDILDAAQEGYATIVLGRRGLSGIKEFFLGSVSSKVLHSAKDISVLLVD